MSGYCGAVASYRYTAVSATGSRTSGVVVGASEQAALAELERMGLTPIELAVATVRAGRARREERVPARQLATAYSQVAELLRAGVPLLRALRLVGRRKSAPKLARAYSQLADAVQDGTELATAMEQIPGAFRPVHVAMVRAGEKGGFLEQSMARLGVLISKQVELKGRVIGSLIYPCVVIFVGTVMLLVVFIFFVPEFKERFAEIQTPMITDVLFMVSDMVTTRWWAGLMVIAGLVVGVLVARRSPAVRGVVVKGLLRSPVLGRLLKDIAVARFCRVLGTLLSSGVPILGSLRIARDAAGFEALASSVDEAIEAVRGGRAMSKPLAQSGFFPEDVIEMLDVAEAANNVDEVLESVAVSLEGRVDRGLTGATRLIEPMLLLVIGGAVAVVALALILPMTKMQ